MNDFVIYQRIRSSDVRRQCSAHKQREPCFICGKHGSITEAHHTIPLKDVAALLAAWGSLPEPPVVWLCPNCHTYLHRYRSAARIYLEPGILEKIFEIQRIGEEFLSMHVEAVMAKLNR